ncbi:protein of unknown function DUF932 (plasmid) [Nitrosococcus halophilus Nc 4]|uniref:DUF945 domain-containing protein n=1 Tax=Nitrosococcus halophilus (strain Nc4) TaxID=472759 RepID=D5C5E4_NITHN|nr:DUF932 domain-containing protein [Nitrosococcus halophilus]ADE16998.1 protein of unknown function DUF932 [Nitrosococcus halophilus Nc 4]
MRTMTQPLSKNQLRKKASSVFATAAHERVSGQYQFISTLAMIEALDREGWMPVHAEENRVRSSDRKGFTKHLLRFRRFDGELPMVGDSFPEIVLVNSHDGSCAYQLHAGLFRLVCSNGMIVADFDMGQVKRRHTGDVVREVIEGTYEIVEELPKIAKKVENFKSIELSPREQEIFAESALRFRWEEGKAPIISRSLLKPRRYEDQSNDMWATYQRAQENMLKGGVQGRSAIGRRITTRAVKSVGGNVKLNKALWFLTEQMAELKKA